MAIVDDAFLQDMGALAADLALKDDCQVERNTTVFTPNGWDQQDPNAPLTPIGTVKCMKYVPSPALLAAAPDRLATLTIWHMAFPLGSDVKEGDLLTVNGEQFKAQTKVVGSYDVLLNFLVSEEI